MTTLELEPVLDEPGIATDVNHLICCSDTKSKDRKTACGLPIPDDEDEVESGEVTCIVCREYATSGTCPKTNQMCPVVWAARGGNGFWGRPG